MGLFDLSRFLAPAGPYPSSTDPLVSRSETLDALTEALYEVIAERVASFSMQDARKLPEVIRSKALLMGVTASYLPLAYRNGMALDDQPRIVSKPDPFGTRYDFVAQTVDSLIDDGCAFWHLSGGEDRRPANARVIPHDEVEVTPGKGIVPEYRWKGRLMIPDVDIKHVTINRRPGELHGRGPLREALTAFATAKAAEEYARNWFSGGGIPPVILKHLAGGLTPAEATAAKSKWVSARATGSEPAVFGKDWDIVFPSADPERSQMQSARSYGATVAARVFGIPGALLHVETSGATITYTNPAGAIEHLTKATLLPTYIAPIEAHWSELLPGNVAVRFDLNDMQRADLAARVAIYQGFVSMGAMVPEEVRAAEGWGPMATDTSHSFDPVPSEVPA